MILLARVRAAPRLASRANTTAARAARAHARPRRRPAHVLINTPCFVLSAGMVAESFGSGRVLEVENAGLEADDVPARPPVSPTSAPRVTSSAGWDVKHRAHRTRLPEHDAMNGFDCLGATAKDIERGSGRDESQEPRVERVWTDDG